MKKVIIISGASTGIGFATLETFVRQGHVVYGGARKETDLRRIERAGGHAVTMEMAEYSTLEKAVKYIMNRENRIDVLFNNAGYGLYGSVEDVPLEAAKHQLEVNLFGLARLTQLVLPHMRSQSSGTIINTSSIAGKIYTPLGAWYHASKHALEGWSDSLRLEVRQFGIHVVLIEPGAIQTPWGKLAADNILKYSSNSAYASYAKSAAKSTLDRYATESNLTPPSKVADVISRAVAAKNPKSRYVVGKYARPLLFIRKHTSDSIFDKLIASQMK